MESFLPIEIIELSDTEYSASSLVSEPVKSLPPINKMRSYSIATAVIPDLDGKFESMRVQTSFMCFIPCIYLRAASKSIFQT